MRACVRSNTPKIDVWRRNVCADGSDVVEKPELSWSSFGYAATEVLISLMLLPLHADKGIGGTYINFAHAEMRI